MIHMEFGNFRTYMLIFSSIFLPSCFPWLYKKNIDFWKCEEHFFLRSPSTPCRPCRSGLSGCCAAGRAHTGSPHHPLLSPCGHSYERKTSSAGLLRASQHHPQCFYWLLSSSTPMCNEFSYPDIFPQTIKLLLPFCLLKTLPL